MANDPADEFNDDIGTNVASSSAATAAPSKPAAVTPWHQYAPQTHAVWQKLTTDPQFSFAIGNPKYPNWNRNVMQQLTAAMRVEASEYQDQDNPNGIDPGAVAKKFRASEPKANEMIRAMLTSPSAPATAKPSDSPLKFLTGAASEIGKAARNLPGEVFRDTLVGDLIAPQAAGPSQSEESAMMAHANQVARAQATKKIRSTGQKPTGGLTATTVAGSATTKTPVSQMGRAKMGPGGGTVPAGSV